mmetsp:Transcript_43058/g.92275  ORF Transcript_43058/g.92275 Transcript_43058/m.92275 type:complete len:165 (-) Transcript_43058:135-629(-)
MTSTSAEAEVAMEPFRGSCFCGACAFEATGVPIFRANCHCTLCQRWIGAPSTAFVGFKDEAMKIVKGEGNMHGFKTTDGMTRYRCKDCGSPVYGQSHLEAFPFRDAPLGLFERDAEGNILRLDELRPLSHIFCSSRIPGLVKADPDDVKKFLAYPGSEQTDACP